MPTTSIRRIARVLPLLLFVSAPIQPAGAVVTEWVDIEMDSGHIFIRCEIAGIPGRALIDTGAQLNMINVAFLAENGLTFDTGRKIEMVGVAGAEFRDVYKEVAVKLYGTELTLREVVGGYVGSPDTQLILGASFLRLFVFQFDYPNQRMRLITRDDVVDLKTRKNVESKQDRRYGGSPIVKVRLDDETDLWLLMDTGASSGILLDRAVAKKAGWLERYPVVDGSISGINQSAATQYLNLTSMQIGPYVLDNPIIIVPAEGEKLEFFREEGSTGSRLRRSRSQLQGILGYDVLRHFVVTVDYQGGHVHLGVP